MNETYSLVVNGDDQRSGRDGETPLIEVLRDELGLCGTRFGCGEGLCGACLVLVDGVPTPSCTMPLWSAAGREVTTVEGLGPEGDRLQRSFTECQAAQCGYCVSGILVAAAALLREVSAPSDDEVRTALDRHLCRCGAQGRMIRAVCGAATLTSPAASPVTSPDASR